MGGGRITTQQPFPERGGWGTRSVGWGMKGRGGLQRYRGGGGKFRAMKNMNLQILARQNLCHFLKVSEQIMYGSQKLLMRNSGHLLFFLVEFVSR